MIYHDDDFLPERTIPDSVMRMSLEDLRAAQSGPHTPRGWNQADLRQAHADIVARMAGIPANGPQHPLAEREMREGGAMGLADMARAFAIMHFGPQAKGWDDRQILSSGAQTSHLADVLADVSNNIALQRAPGLLSKVLRITRPVELTDYRAANVGVVELDADNPLPSPSTTEFLQWTNIQPTSSAEDLKLASVPLRVRFSEQLITNDDINALVRTLEAALVAASQNELATAFGILTANGNLSDGAPLFSTGASNLVTSATKDADGLDSALAALRAQQSNGKNADCDPVALVVPSSDESTARALVAGMSTAEPWVEVIGTSYVTAQWYLAADPAIWPVVCRGTLRGSNGESLRFVPGLPNGKEGSRDLIMTGSHAVAYAPVSRVGMVRMTF